MKKFDNGCYIVLYVLSFIVGTIFLLLYFDDGGILNGITELKISIVLYIIGLIGLIIGKYENYLEEAQKNQVPLFFGEVVDGDEFTFIENLKKKFNILPTEEKGKYTLPNFSLFGNKDAKLVITENYDIIENVSLIFPCDANTYNALLESLKDEFKKKNYPDLIDNHYKFNQYCVIIIHNQKYFNYVIYNNQNISDNKVLREEIKKNDIKSFTEII